MRKINIILVFLLLTVPCQARVITVGNNPPADFNNIQAAIDDANDGDTVLVADGTYTGPGNRDIDFNGLAITVMSENGPTNCIIDCNGSSGEPHRAFFFHSGEDSDSVVAGFTITRGFASGSGYDRLGGGILCLGFPWPKVINCIFRDNYADWGGGGLAAGWMGGGQVVNCTFQNNTAGFAGGGVSLSCYASKTLSLRNCIVWGNEPNDDPGVYGSYEGIGGWQWVRVDYCILQGDWQDKPYIYGADNIVADPCFANVDANDFHLKSQAGRWDPNTSTWVVDSNTSPCIDAGDPMSPIGLEPFPNGGIINMGAYGGTTEASKSYFGKPPCEVIMAGDINGDCEVNFKDFWFIAFDWLGEY